MRTRTALAGIALAVGATFGVTGGAQSVAYPCTGGGCVTTDEPSVIDECGGEQCLSHPCNGAECAIPQAPSAFHECGGNDCLVYSRERMSISL